MPANKRPRKAYKPRLVSSPFDAAQAEGFRTRMLAYLVKKELGIFECLDSGHDAAYHLNGILIGLCAASSAGAIDEGTMHGPASGVIRSAMDAADDAVKHDCRITREQALQISIACQHGARILKNASRRALQATEFEIRKQFGMETS